MNGRATGTAERSAARFAARRRAVRRHSAVRRVLLASFATVALLAVWVVAFSGLLAVRQVVIVGAGGPYLQLAQVRAAVGPVRGQPLARVNLAAVRDRVGALPPVARVAVSRSWPTTLRVVVAERRPVAGIALPTGGVELVDGQGVQFATAPALPKGVLPLDAHGGEPVSAALAVLASLPPQVRHQVLALAAPSPVAVTLTLRGGREVVWGGPEDSTEKAQVLAALLAHPAHLYDVSAPGVAVVK